MKTDRLAKMALMIALTALSARVSVPVPGTSLVFSAQVCVVLCAGLLLGPLDGALSQGLYVLLGLTGAPVFAMGGGLGYVMHPTFGYLLGFPAAAWACGAAARRIRLPRITSPRRAQFWAQLLAGLLGIVALYAVALPYTQLTARIAGRSLPALGTFLYAYCLTFLPVDAVKAILAAALCGRMLARGVGKKQAQ